MDSSASPPQSSNSGRKARNSTLNHSFLVNLPSQIMVEILARLPAKSIIQCKTVCKNWLQLISDPYFIRLHRSVSKPGLVVHQSEMFKKFIRLIDFDEKSDHHKLAYDSTMVKFNLSSLSSFSDANIVVDGSVDGFLFLRDINYKHETLYVCNPITREYIELPRPKRVWYPMVVTHGFGVAEETGEYKVVRIFHDRKLHPISGACMSVPYSECCVYTLGTGEWRSLGSIGGVYDSQAIGVFLQGNLHWLIKDLEGHELISCFDLKNETFRPFPTPFRSGRLLWSLGVLKGCLCLCDNSPYSEIDIWVMKEYGVQRSWGKEFVIEKMPLLAGITFDIVHALKVFGDGGVLIMWKNYCMLYCSSKGKLCEEVDMDQTRGPNCIEAMNYVPSFMKLRSFAMEKVIMF